MLTIGIESTAHTLGIGICDGRKILANERATFKPKFSGIHPRKAADFQAREFESTLRSALATAGAALEDISLFAFSQGPGLGACLRISCAAARFLSLLCKKPIIGVNHCVAHIEISKLLTGAKDPLVVYVSGGNTQIILRERNRYRVIGETLDIGVGNLFDVFARKLGLRYAHGGTIEQLAREGKYLPLPYTVKGMDLVFTGLLTAAEKKIATEKKEDLCFSLQETSFAMITEAAERALALCGKKELIACGGVAQNKRLCEMLSLMAKPHRCRFGVAPNEFNADNGAMIAYAGWLMHEHGARMPLADAVPKQKFRTDEVELNWQ